MAGHVRYRLIKRWKGYLSPDELERFRQLPAPEQLERARQGLLELLAAYAPRAAVAQTADQERDPGPAAAEPGSHDR